MEADLQGEKLGYKIASSRARRIPLTAVAGGREQDSCSLAVRLRNGTNISLKKNVFIEKVLKIIQKKERDLLSNLK